MASVELRDPPGGVAAVAGNTKTAAKAASARHALVTSRQKPSRANATPPDCPAMPCSSERIMVHQQSGVRVLLTSKPPRSLPESRHEEIRSLRRFAGGSGAESRLCCG